MGAVRAAFKPEFVNRLDDIVIFDALSMEELGSIVDIQVLGLDRRLRERRLVVEVTEAARQWLGERGYDPMYGARPLRRLMQREIDDRLARALLAGEVRDGDTVVVDVQPGGSGLWVGPQGASRPAQWSFDAEPEADVVEGEPIDDL
jgi:ATP-dependent Clp protease ATP-binding subunit ClpB